MVSANFLIGIVCGMMLSVGLFFYILPVQSIPPTIAFSNILINETEFKADSYSSYIRLGGLQFNVEDESNGVYLGLKRLAYGQIIDLSTQECAMIDTPQNITLNSNYELYAIDHSIIDNSNEITITQDGIYQILAVPQVGKTQQQSTGVYNFWLLKNGVAINNTNVKLELGVLSDINETSVLTFNWISEFDKDDVISFQQSCTNTGIGILFTDESVSPDTPSIIISIAQTGW